MNISVISKGTKVLLASGKETVIKSIRLLRGPPGVADYYRVRFKGGGLGSFYSIEGRNYSNPSLNIQKIVE